MSIAGFPTAAVTGGAPMPLAGFWHKVLRGKNAWALADQILISGSNFVTAVLVARAMSGNLSAFGQYSNVYNGLLLANVLQVGLITQPHNVLGTERRSRGRGEYIRYTASTGVGQLGLATVEAILAGLLALIGTLKGWSFAPMLVALMPAIVAWQLQEFVRRVLYTEGRTGAAFINDLISYGGQSVWIAACWWTGRLDGPVALYVLAATSAAAMLLGIWQLRHSIFGAIEWASLFENWRFGKWLVGSEIVAWRSSLQMYMFLVAWIAGAAATGELKAAQILFGPTRIISFFLATVLPIQFAQQLARGGRSAMNHRLKMILTQVVPLLGVYCLLVAVFAKPLLKLAYGEHYSGRATVLSLYAAVAFASYFQTMIAAALTAQRRTRFIFLGSVAGLCVTLIAAWGLIRLLGVYGALTGLLLTSGVVIGLLWRGYGRGEGRAETGPLAPPLAPGDASAAA